MAHYIRSKSATDYDTDAQFLIKEFGALPERVFDQCCGLGLSSFGFITRGCEYVGVDIQPDYIRYAMENADLGSTYYCSDASKFVLEEPADIAFNWHSSLLHGTLDTIRGMLRSAYLSLRDNGAFFVDLFNISYIRSHFSPILRASLLIDGKQINLERYSELYSNGNLVQNWRFLDGDQLLSSETSSLTTMPHDELIALIIDEGFRDPILWSSVSGSGFHPEMSPRLIIKVQK
jgi:SAM-dependent methyltransferase